MKRPLLLGAASMLLGVLPAIPGVAAIVIAHLNQCALDEGSVHPCVVLGTDWGEALYSMMMMFWLLFLSLPVGALGVMVSGIWLVVVLARRR